MNTSVLFRTVCLFFLPLTGAVMAQPVADDSAFTVSEGSTHTGMVTASGGEGPALNFALMSGPALATLTFNSDGSFSYQSVRQPTVSFVGTDSFTFVANDGQDSSNVATVTVTITAVNDPPLANSGAFALAEGSTHNGAVSATDVDGDALSFRLDSEPSYGTLAFNADGSFIYQADRQPTVGFVGTDSFTFVANDGLMDSNVATVTATIVPVNDAPVAQDSTFSVDEGATHVGVVSATDPDGDALSFALASGPSYGSLVFNANGSFSYQSFADSSDMDSFTFRASDGLANSNTATVSIAIRLDALFADRFEQ